MALVAGPYLSPSCRLLDTSGAGACAADGDDGLDEAIRLWKGIMNPGSESEGVWKNVTRSVVESRWDSTGRAAGTASDRSGAAPPPQLGAAGASAPDAAANADGPACGTPPVQPAGAGASLRHLAHQNGLAEGTKHFRSAICSAADLSVFDTLRAELYLGASKAGSCGKIGLGPWSWAGGIGGDLARSSPYRVSVGAEQLEELESQGLPTLTRVLRQLKDTVRAKMDKWWANIYEDGSVGCKFHQDGRETEDSITASVSFGSPRDFVLRHMATGHEFAFRLENGDVFTFNKDVDRTFMHGVYPADEDLGPRISIIMLGRSSPATFGEPAAAPSFYSGSSYSSSHAWAATTIRKQQDVIDEQWATIRRQQEELRDDEDGGDVGAAPGAPGQGEKYSDTQILYQPMQGLLGTINAQKETIQKQQIVIERQRKALEKEERRTHKYLKAEQAWTAVLLKEPDNLAALEGRGWMRLKLRRYAEAEEDFAAVLEVDPKNESANMGLNKASFADLDEIWAVPP